MNAYTACIQRRKVLKDCNYWYYLNTVFETLTLSPVLKDCNYWYYLNHCRKCLLLCLFLRIVIIGIIWTFYNPRNLQIWFLRIVIIGIIWTPCSWSKARHRFLRIVIIGIIWTSVAYCCADCLSSFTVLNNELGTVFICAHPLCFSCRHDKVQTGYRNRIWTKLHFYVNRMMDSLFVERFPENKYLFISRNNWHCQNL